MKSSSLPWYEYFLSSFGSNTLTDTGGEGAYDF